MHKVHIALQELQAVMLMLCRMSFQLYGKVVALHWYYNIAEVYIYMTPSGDAE